MKKNIIILIVSLAMFMESVDTTVINTAIPAMAHSMKVNPIDLKIALISYLLSLAIFIPVSGWIADKFGAKKVFIFAVSVFTLSSIWCGFTQSLWELIIARIVQGLGGSLTMPVGRLIIIRTCERHELISKMSMVVMITAVGMMLGPLLGGFITDHFSWRWIFWVNAPVGVLALISSLKLLPEMPSIPVPVLDKFGFFLFGSGLAVLTLGLSMISESNISYAWPILMIMAAMLLLFFYSRHSYQQQHPIVNIDLLQSRTFRVSVLGNLFARLGFGGIPFLVPLLLQIGLGFSPQLSGLLLAPVALGVFLVKPMSLHFLRFLGYKKLLILNTLLVSLSLCSFSFIKPATTLLGIGCLTFFYGFLISLQYTGMNSLAYANISQNETSAATSIMSTIQQLSQSFGVAIAAIMVRFFSENLSGHPSLSIHTFHQTFYALACVTLVSMLIFIPLKKDDGHELIDIPHH